MLKPGVLDHTSLRARHRRRHTFWPETLDEIVFSGRDAARRRVQIVAEAPDQPIDAGPRAVKRIDRDQLEHLTRFPARQPEWSAANRSAGKLGGSERPLVHLRQC